MIGLLTSFLVLTFHVAVSSHSSYLNDMPWMPTLRIFLLLVSFALAGSGFFFVGKKDSGLGPCIDYGGLNKITIRNHYPLPLMSSAFDLLEGVSIFTELDLSNAYQLIWVWEGNEWKTTFNREAN